MCIRDRATVDVEIPVSRGGKTRWYHGQASCVGGKEMCIRDRSWIYHACHIHAVKSYDFYILRHPDPLLQHCVHTGNGSHIPAEHTVNVRVFLQKLRCV